MSRIACSGARTSSVSRCPSGLTNACTMTSSGMSWAAGRPVKSSSTAAIDTPTIDGAPQGLGLSEFRAVYTARRVSRQRSVACQHPGTSSIGASFVTVLIGLGSRQAVARTQAPRRRMEKLSRRRGSRSIRSGPSRCRTTGSSARRSASASTRRITSASSIAAATTLERADRDRRGHGPADGGGLLRAGAAGARVRSRRQPRRPLGRPGRGLRLAGLEPRHHRRPQGQRLDRRQRRRTTSHVAEVHARRQVPDADRHARARARGSNDTENFGGSAKIFVDPKANEAYVADGYGNRRVAVIDADTGKFKRYWGAYGNKPDDTNLGRYDPDAPPAQQFRTPVHCAELSNDGLVYVCDRPNDRIQVFQQGRHVREGSVHRARRRSATARCGTSRSRRTRSRSTSTSPTARTRRSTSCERDTLEILTSFGDGGRQPGQFFARAQHRDRLEGQHLHDRDLRRKAPAEVRLQGPRAGHAAGPGTRPGRSLAK